MSSRHPLNRDLAICCLRVDTGNMVVSLRSDSLCLIHSPAKPSSCESIWISYTTWSIKWLMPSPCPSKYQAKELTLSLAWSKCDHGVKFMLAEPGREMQKMRTQNQRASPSKQWNCTLETSVSDRQTAWRKAFKVPLYLMHTTAQKMGSLSKSTSSSS